MNAKQEDMKKLEEALLEYTAYHHRFMNMSIFDSSIERMKVQYELDAARERYIVARKKIFPNQIIIGGGCFRHDRGVV